MGISKLSLCLHEFTQGCVWGSPWGAQVHWDQLLPSPSVLPSPPPYCLSPTPSISYKIASEWGNLFGDMGGKRDISTPAAVLLHAVHLPRPSPEARKAKGTVLELTLLLCLNVSFIQQGSYQVLLGKELRLWQGPYNGHLKTLVEDGKLSPCVAPCACLLTTIHSCFPWCLVQGWHEIANQI